MTTIILYGRHVLSKVSGVAAWLSVLALAVASWTPKEEMIRTGASGQLEHVAAYFISALLWVTAYPGWSPRLVGSILAIYAGVLEVGQIYAPGRHSPIEDFAASCFGVALVVLPTPWIRRRKDSSLRRSRAIAR